VAGYRTKFEWLKPRIRPIRLFRIFCHLVGSYNLALIPIVCSLAVGAVGWLRIDATEELILNEGFEPTVGAALPVPS
jgi:hypothetical protein